MGVSDLQFDTNAGKWLYGCFVQTDSDGHFLCIGSRSENVHYQLAS